MNTTDRPSAQTGAKPTIVLVHGAFADASSWNGVIERLQQQGYTAVAPANPLRGVTADSAYTASLLNQIDGPVLLAGHSYGGAVITNAATSAPNVAGLVFVAAFAPDEGETLGEVENGSKDSSTALGRPWNRTELDDLDASALTTGRHRISTYSACVVSSLNTNFASITVCYC